MEWKIYRKKGNSKGSNEGEKTDNNLAVFRGISSPVDRPKRRSIRPREGWQAKMNYPGDDSAVGMFA